MEEIIRFIYRSVVSKSSRTGSILGKYYHIIKKIDHPVGGVCDDYDDLSLVRYAAKGLKQISRNDSVKPGIGFIKYEERWIAYEFKSDRQSLALSAGEFPDLGIPDRDQAEFLKYICYPLLSFS